MQKRVGYGTASTYASKQENIYLHIVDWVYCIAKALLSNTLMSLHFIIVWLHKVCTLRLYSKRPSKFTVIRHSLLKTILRFVHLNMYVRVHATVWSVDLDGGAGMITENSGMELCNA